MFFFSIGCNRSQAPKLNAVKDKIRVDFIFADAMKQAGWVAEATLLFVHANFSAKNLIELRTKADGMKVWGAMHNPFLFSGAILYLLLRK